LLPLGESVNNPAVADTRKKVVNKDSDQVKKVISQASPATPAAQ
jgi:hypothetical protein